MDAQTQFWISIVISIVTLVIAAINPFLTNWLNRRRAQDVRVISSDINQPKTGMKRLRGFLSGTRLGILMVVIGGSNSIYAIVKAVNNAGEPISLRSVLLISLHIATIQFLCVLVLMTALTVPVLSAGREALGLVQKSHEKIPALISKVEALSDSLDKSVDVVRQLQKELKPKKKGLLD